MKIVITYIFPNQLAYESLARRFADKYQQYPPGQIEHMLYVIANGGGHLTPRQERLFVPLRPTFLYHDNSAKDLGAYFMAARMIDCDLLVCLGAPVRPCRAGWLDAIVSAVENNGPGLYGFWGSHAPTTHLRTTSFVITPQILQAYPIQITNERRYEFEFSTHSITAFTMKQGFPVMQVTARGAYPPEKFHTVSREDSLLLDQFDKHYGYTD